LRQWRSGPAPAAVILPENPGAPRKVKERFITYQRFAENLTESLLGAQIPFRLQTLATIARLYQVIPNEDGDVLARSIRLM